MKQVEQVCIIDDDDIFIYGAKRLFAKSEICSNFLVFHNGQEALDGLKEIIRTEAHLPELILLDLNMPVMDGWEFLDEFIKLGVRDKATLYIVSSSIDPNDYEKAKQYEEVSSFIAKPISPAKLKSLIEGNS